MVHFLTNHPGDILYVFIQGISYHVDGWCASQTPTLEHLKEFLQNIWSHTAVD